MKFCLLVTAALDIFIKEKNNTLYLPWISPSSFSYAKGVYSVKLSGKVSYLPFSDPPRIFHPSLAYYIVPKFPTPCLLELPRLFGTLEYDTIPTHPE